MHYADLKNGMTAIHGMERKKKLSKSEIINHSHESATFSQAVPRQEKFILVGVLQEIGWEMNS